jgi:thiamine kinase-like enzyme
LHSSIHAIKNPGFTKNKDQLLQRIDVVNILSNPEKNKIMQYLKKLPEGESLCHGDFHPENVLLSNSKDFVIDWMTATQGNSCSDVAHTDLLLRYGVSPEEKHGIEKFITNMVRNKFADLYINTYLKITNVNRDSIKSWKLPNMASMLNDIMSNSTKEQFLREIRNLSKR